MTCEQNVFLHISTKLYNNDVIQTKIMAILSTGAFRFAVFPIEIYTKKKQLLFLTALTNRYKSWSTHII